MSYQKKKALTFRVENIPFGTTKDRLVKDYFDVKDHDAVKVKSLVPAVESAEGEKGDLTATILFRPPEPVPGGPRVHDESITVDQDFRGFTPLYVPPKELGPIVADIIAITGLAGHAFGSWAHSQEHMWLRDYLPRDAPKARILCYGYYSDLLGSNSVNILQDHTNKFAHSLVDMREEGQCDSRPIIFIGHSLGCLIIKKTLIDAASLGIESSRLPVRGIIFLAPPHRGLNITALHTLVKGETTEQLILELKSDSPTLTWLNQAFAYYVRTRDIDILTCYENKPTKTVIKVDGVWKRDGPPVMMVTFDSARQYYPKEKLVASDTDHSQIAKIKRGQSGIYPAVRSAIRHGLLSAAKDIAGEAADAKTESSRSKKPKPNLGYALPVLEHAGVISSSKDQEPEASPTLESKLDLLHFNDDASSNSKIQEMMALKDLEKQHSSFMIVDDIVDDNSVIRVSPQNMENEGLQLGDTVLVKGNNKEKYTVLIVMSDHKLSNYHARMSRTARENAGVKVGDKVIVVSSELPQDIEYLKHLTILPIGDTILGFTGSLFDTFLQPYFDNTYRPVREGDIYKISGDGREAEFEVLKTEPPKYGIVAQGTLIQSEGMPIPRGNMHSTRR